MKNYHILKNIVKLFRQVVEKGVIFFTYDLEYSDEDINRIKELMTLDEYYEAVNYIINLIVENIHLMGYEEENGFSIYSAHKMYKGKYIEICLLCGFGDDLVIKLRDKNSSELNVI